MQRMRVERMKGLRWAAGRATGVAERPRGWGQLCHGAQAVDACSYGQERIASRRPTSQNRGPSTDSGQVMGHPVRWRSTGTEGAGAFRPMKRMGKRALARVVGSLKLTQP